MFSPHEEEALVFALLERIKDYSDSEFRASGSLADYAYEALAEAASNPLVVVHVDAGARTIDIPARPVSLVKVAVYELDLSQGQPRSGVYYHVYRWRAQGTDRLANILYLVGDYRVRQALGYLVEIATLLSETKRHAGKGATVIGLKDGPLVQQIAQYLSPEFDVDENIAVYALRYAGLEAGEALDIVSSSKRSGSGGHMVSTGLMMLHVLDRLREMAEQGEAYPAGVVEDTSRSTALITILLVEMLINGLRRMSGGDAKVLAAKIHQEVLDWANSTPIRSELAPCLCMPPKSDTRILSMLLVVLEELAERMSKSLTVFGIMPGNIDGLAGEARRDPGGLAIKLARALILSQVSSSLRIRDPDLVMLAYYMGILESYATKPSPRLGLLASARDAVERGRAKEGLEKEAQDALDRLLPSVLGGVRMRYIITDPPPTCEQLEDRLGQAGLKGVVTPCMAASLDTYSYAPPVRLEFYREPPGSLLTKLVVLESILARYKYPYGLLIADRASRITREEALTAKPLEKRLIPLRYYVRSWERRAENY